MMSGKSELKIFDDHPPQVVIDAGYFEDIYPRTALDATSTVIEFFVPGSEVDYLDLNDTYLYVCIRVVKKDDSIVLNSDQQPVPTNWIMYTLFRDVSLSLNATQIEGGSQLYPFKAVIESALNSDRSTKDSQLYILGYDTNDSSRASWAEDSKTVELVGALRLDFLSHPKYLIPGVDVRIKLTRASDDFALSYKTGDPEPPDGTWKVKIEKAVLNVRRVKVHSAITKAHELGLELQNALYPYTRSSIMDFSIPKGTASYTKDNLFSSSLLPKLVVIGMVSGSSFNGTLRNHSLSFRHFDVTRVDLLRNGQSIPYRQGYQLDFSTNTYVESYFRSILQSMNAINNSNSSPGIYSGNWQNGETFFVFNLAPDFDVKERQTVKDSNLRLELSFKTSLPHPINVIAYSVYDATLQITKSREIIRDVFS